MVSALTQTQAAAIVGVTARRLRQMDQEPDPPPKNSNGQYDPELFGRWLDVRRRSALVTMDDGKVLDLNDERARLTHHQANIAALDEQIKQKSLIPYDVVVERWQMILANFRAKALGMPSSLASVCADSPRDDVQKQSEVLVRQMLEDLAGDVDY